MYANSGDLDQMPRSAASDLSLHYSHRSQKRHYAYMGIRVLLDKKDMKRSHFFYFGMVPYR